MKHSLARTTEVGSVPFFIGTTGQCLWKLLRHVVNVNTVTVNGKPAVTWLTSLNVKSFTFRTSVTGFTIHYKGAGTKNLLPSVLRAEKKFATTY